MLDGKVPVLKTTAIGIFPSVVCNLFFPYLLLFLVVLMVEFKVGVIRVKC